MIVSQESLEMSKKQIRDQVGNQVWDQINVQVYDQVKVQAYLQVLRKFRNEQKAN